MDALDVSRNLSNIADALAGDASRNTTELLEHLSVTLEELRTISSICNTHSKQAHEQLEALDLQTEKFGETFEKIDNLKQYMTDIKIKLANLDHFCTSLERQSNS
ncbi:unnamed protein product [Caenorhabditis angaria]|uniref:Uncharacterized protein n=1 Tax=Caenorhabditis angaria TaxID=860376 RepID=A0A9P1IAM3_9PELO|nr:unnamed protein product [Caenorhabditis angaria]